MTGIPLEAVLIFKTDSQAIPNIQKDVSHHLFCGCETSFLFISYLLSILSPISIPLRVSRYGFHFAWL